LKDEKGKIVLFRLMVRAEALKIPTLSGCHIHTARAERINNGLKPEGQIDMFNSIQLLKMQYSFTLDGAGV
jgi:hypothetical protein